MIKFKFLPPYQKDGKTTFPESINKSGVYIIKEDNGIVYVGYSATDLYKTLYRHFQQWNDKTYQGSKVIDARNRVTYYSRLKTHDFKVRLVYCTPAQAVRLERVLIWEHNPRDNFFKYQDRTPTTQDYNTSTAYDSLAEGFEAPF